MSEPLEMVVERSAAQSAQALLLARVFATVVTLVLLLMGLIVCPAGARFGAMFAELGTDGQLPVISAIVVRQGGVILMGLLVLAAITMFFIWAKGKMAAWMAGMGLLIMALCVPLMVFALFMPLVKIISEMGNM